MTYLFHEKIEQETQVTENQSLLAVTPTMPQTN